MACCTSPYSNEHSRLQVVRWWTVAQCGGWLLGLGLLLTLWWQPTLGLHIFWDVLIPVAPALVMLAPGLWRNICPLGTTSQLGRRILTYRGGSLQPQRQARLGLVGVLLLITLVPLRHPWFNLSGTATLFLLLAAGITALLVGGLFSGKSGWCAGICPVHAVERLYGTRPIATVTSGHCSTCVRCTVPCPDTTPGIRHGQGHSTIARKSTRLLIIGGFPGFVLGWFQVQDGSPILEASTWLWPIGCMVISMVLWMLLQFVLPKTDSRKVDAIFATLAISSYYWFRIPALFGFGVFPGDGQLVNLNGVVPFEVFNIARIALVMFFVWWLIIRRPTPKPWMYKPPQVNTKSKPIVISIGLAP